MASLSTLGWQGSLYGDVQQGRARGRSSGHALAQLLTLPLYITIIGTPGAPDVQALTRSA
jgi:hypothetical protein